MPSPCPPARRRPARRMTRRPGAPGWPGVRRSGLAHGPARPPCRAEDIRCTRCPLRASRRAMLSELRALPAPLLLLASVLSETLAAKGDHISFVIGPFRPRVGPPSDPEPRGPSLHRGAPESVEPAMAQRGELGSRVVNAAGPLPRHLLSETSRRARLGWPRQRCCVYRALLAPCPWPPGALKNSPIRVACVHARACPLFLCFAASSSSSSQYAGYWD
ncbi:PREDICTED: LOW QUALITY PROTEIN: putative uncharacterized protein UNQ6490/PRO21339-like [Lipotes vexillifer]|uniref:Uncharacterized protein n=1 Tax=Lipotes vexillifer TaxID=118797 RepID=A0A340Y089_LIPVE|nr:PREDICTED: LOW QUALITY PROTEIN: putative uncharacterized protein UNQ6490/PRO21339-like [Lipotes vexillifer]